MIRNMGYACMNLTLGDTKSRTMRLGNFNIFQAGHCSLLNVRDLKRMVEWNAANGVKMFRIPSEIFPYADHPSAGYRLRQLPQFREIRDTLIETGKLANTSGIRLTTHPGPFTIIASGHAAIVNKSIRHLDHQAEIGAWLGTQDFSINVHIGRSFSISASAVFIENFKRLSSAARNFLTLENDDKNNCWSVEDLHANIYQYVGVPIVFDTHHWRFCRRSTMLTSARLALSTWGSRFPKMHHSESDPTPGVNPRAHSLYIQNPVPQFNIDRPYDLILEAKAKDLALLRYWREHGRNQSSDTGRDASKDQG